MVRYGFYRGHDLLTMKFCYTITVYIFLVCLQKYFVSNQELHKLSVEEKTMTVDTDITADEAQA